tara:strand:+ start:57 stop:521 length:465 start_codon:yes stop_codon:yes gene_type:complete
MYEDIKEKLPIINSLILLFILYKIYYKKEYFSRSNEDNDIVLLDPSGNVQTFKLKNIYDSIKQAKDEMRKEMRDRVEKRGQDWANWAIDQVRPSIDSKIGEGTANGRFVYKNSKILIANIGRRNGECLDCGKGNDNCHLHNCDRNNNNQTFKII